MFTKSMMLSLSLMLSVSVANALSYEVKVKSQTSIRLNTTGKDVAKRDIVKGCNGTSSDKSVGPLYTTPSSSVDSTVDLGTKKEFNGSLVPSLEGRHKVEFIKYNFSVDLEEVNNIKFGTSSEYVKYSEKDHKSGCSKHYRSYSVTSSEIRTSIVVSMKPSLDENLIQFTVDPNSMPISMIKVKHRGPYSQRVHEISAKETFYVWALQGESVDVELEYVDASQEKRDASMALSVKSISSLNSRKPVLDSFENLMNVLDAKGSSADVEEAVASILNRSLQKIYKEELQSMSLEKLIRLSDLSEKLRISIASSRFTYSSSLLSMLEDLATLIQVFSSGRELDLTSKHCKEKDFDLGPGMGKKKIPAIVMGYLFFNELKESTDQLNYEALMLFVNALNEVAGEEGSVELYSNTEAMDRLEKTYMLLQRSGRKGKNPILGMQVALRNIEKNFGATLIDSLNLQWIKNNYSSLLNIQNDLYKDLDKAVEAFQRRSASPVYVENIQDKMENLKQLQISIKNRVHEVYGKTLYSSATVSEYIANLEHRLSKARGLFLYLGEKISSTEDRQGKFTSAVSRIVDLDDIESRVKSYCEVIR